MRERLMRPMGGLSAFAVFAFAVLTLVPMEASATHFRYGHIFSAPGAAQNEVVFSFQAAFRRDGYFGTASDGRPAVGDIITETVGATSFRFGDGSSTATLRFLVTSIDVTNNWLFAVALNPGTNDAGIRHTYAAPGTYTAFIDSCCRISASAPPNAHINNPDGRYRVETTVTVDDGDRTAVSVMPPIVVCPFNDVCTFSVPASDTDGDELRWRLSTSLEASGTSSFVQPGPPHATSSASIDSATGVYSWDTTGATVNGSLPNSLYSTQVTIESLDELGGVKSSVAVDFLIRLAQVTGDPPVFNTPPTPLCGSTVTAFVDELFTFTVEAQDPDALDITLNVVGLPVGATMNPSLPDTQLAIASSDFAWTPTASQLGAHVMTFIATDADDQTALCTVTIDVEEAEDISAGIDVLPTSCPNPVNVTQQGLLPVAILGSSDFDVTDIDVATVRLEGVAALRSALEDVATPYTSGFSDPPDRRECTTDGADSYVDLTLKFALQEIAAALGPVSDREVLLVTLSGELYDGTPFTGQDVVEIHSRDSSSSAAACSIATSTTRFSELSCTVDDEMLEASLFSSTRR